MPLDTADLALDFDPDALREKYRQERDKRLRADGNDQYVEVEGRLQPLHRRPLRRAGLHPRAADRRGRRRWSSAAASAACWPRARLREAGVERHPHHREGRRLRRHLVLEPLSRRAVRHRELHLPAAARRDRLHPEGEVLASRRRSSSTARRIGEHFDLYERRLLPDRRSRELRWRRTRQRWLITTNRGDAHEGALRGHVERAAEPAEAARHSRASRASRATVPHQPLGLRLHRRRLQRRT